jgi:putative oxidoreductase
MASFMAPYGAQTYALMRIVIGFLMLWHGAQKLFGFPVGMPDGVPGFVVWVAGPIEFFGGILVMIGLMTRWAAFLSSGTMAAAYWMGHGTRDVLPMMNGGELAAIYCFVFLHISAQGAGIWSVDGSGSKR